MIERLTRGPASVSELAAPLAMSFPAVFQHLKVLESSGLIRSEKLGRVRTCQLEAAALNSVEQWLATRRAEAGKRLDRLGDYLARTAEPLPPLTTTEDSATPSKEQI